MILYRVLRRVARIALTWYYADLVVEGGERVPTDGAVLIVANHPNALVDAMVVTVTVTRRVLLTAKATLFEQPLLATLLRTVGVVPLRRAKDEHTATIPAPTVARNVDAFHAVTTALAHGGVVLIFPEGISHDAPALAPLRTGAARMALQAHAAGVMDLRVVAAGITYEAKERARSRIAMRFETPLPLDAWLAVHPADAGALTMELEARLRRVTLNFATEERAREVMQLARALDSLAAPVSPLAQPRPLGPETDVARRIEHASEALATASAPVVEQANALVAATEAFERRLSARGVALSELRISPAVAPGAWFVIREALVLALAMPVAMVDRTAHDLPVRVARWYARRSLVADPSRDQPAMRTILLGTGFVLIWYTVIGAILIHWFGWVVAGLALATMLLCASAELSMRDRLSRAWRRARTYVALRADPAVRRQALDEAERLLEEAMLLERALRVTTDARATDTA
jgi:glycerol-3-phosphate O-acyltransferase/dihydroxyacetone phosphate acyltransferase